ncbi:outer membrane beta-barrel protein [Hufsiella arboris]|nr:outer membrane beta-barrel protein [Hufsiella arboris]
MKTYMKFIAPAFTAAALFLASSSNAQTSTGGDSHATRLGVGLNVGVPTTDGFSFAIGGDLRLQKDFSSNISGLLSAGYNSFQVKDSDGGGSWGYIPVKAGIKVFPIERFYISGELGAAFGTDDQGTAFVYAPGIGVGFNNGLDIGLRYEGMGNSKLNDTNIKINNPDQVALRIAYGFNLGK